MYHKKKKHVQSKQFVTIFKTCFYRIRDAFVILNNIISFMKNERRYIYLLK